MTHLEFWDKEFGHKEVAYDFAGREIHRDCYGDFLSPYGWNVDHILPKSNGGTDRLSNLQITNIKTNMERSSLITFTANERYFEVRHISNCCSYYADFTDYDYSNKEYAIVEF